MGWGSLFTYYGASHMIFIEPIMPKMPSLYSIAVTKNVFINENKFVAVVVNFWVAGFFLSLSYKRLNNYYLSFQVPVI